MKRAILLCVCVIFRRIAISHTATYELYVCAFLLPWSICKFWIGNCPRRRSSLQFPLQMLKMLKKMLPLWIQTSIFFQLVSLGSNGKSKLTGAALFDHMCSYRSRMLGKEGAWKYERSNHIELSFLNIQMEYIQPTKHKLKRGNIIWYAVGDCAELKVERNNLNTIGNNNGHWAV